MLNNFPVSISGFCRSGLKGDTILQGSRIAVIIAQKNHCYHGASTPDRSI